MTRPDGPNLERWRTILVGAASALLDRAAGANPWLVADGARPALVAIGVSTVDWERAAGTLGGKWRPVQRDPLLGATAHVLEAAHRGSASGDEPLFVLLEPDTEGLLAASLARFGEGLAVVYTRPAGSAGPARVAGRRARDGPFGPALLVHGPAWGPHVVVLRSAATIGR